jgi:surface antigen
MVGPRGQGRNFGPVAVIYSRSAKRTGARLESALPGAPALRRAAVAALAVTLAALTCGCAMSVPIAALGNADPQDDVTGSIDRPSLARLLEAEDLRRAEAALATALDPRANGALVAWANPQSGSKGSFTPRGSAYPDDAEICRRFDAEIERKGAMRVLRGTACTARGSEWRLAAIDPALASAAHAVRRLRVD